MLWRAVMPDPLQISWATIWITSAEVGRSAMNDADPRRTFDAIVIGAGVVGACCAHYLIEAGLQVAIIDRGSVASGTTGAGEGNILVSDKEPGPELDLALLSRRL